MADEAGEELLLDVRVAEASWFYKFYLNQERKILGTGGGPGEPAAPTDRDGSTPDSELGQRPSVGPVEAHDLKAVGALSP